MTAIGSAPIFIGGTNGSGTRVYAAILEQLGVYQGRPKNNSFEPEEIIRYTRPLVPELLKITGSPVYDVRAIPHDFRNKMEAWILAFGLKAQIQCPAEFSRWGWKHPRNMFLVPLLNFVFPDCYFVHVVRDGRDMALADKTGDVRLFHDVFFRSGVSKPDLADCTFFWSGVNCAVADWCGKTLGKRYIWSRLEDLCDNPRREILRLADAIGLDLPQSDVEQCVELVSRPKSLGRWRNLPPTTQTTLRDAGSIGLSRFGYTRV